MTPRQIERAVNASMSRILPPLVQQLRDGLVADLRQHLAARDEGAATDAALLSALHQHLAGPDAVPVAVSPALVEAPAAGPWTLGTGSRRRLTDAGRARLLLLRGEGKSAAEIAAELGVSQRTVHGLPATAPAPAPKVPQIERDATRAEKVRAYQREWTRKRRAMKAAAGEAKAPAVPDARTVVVVPAAEVPAPRQPASPSLSSMVVAKVTPAPAKPSHQARASGTAPQVIAATAKEVRAWLIASMKAGGLTLIQAQDRVGFMTHDQALADANQRRLRAGMPPFTFLGARSAA